MKGKLDTLIDNTFQGTVVKKVFQLTDPKRHTDRVLEAIKHELRKYTKREKRKELADPEATYCDFKCKIGVTAEEAKSIAYEDMLSALDGIHATGATQVYIEIMAEAVLKPLKEKISDDESAKLVATQDDTASE